jgi:hypothetical protein
LTNR